MEQLPFIDEHVAATDAPRDEVWTKLIGMLRGMIGGGSSAFARVLGCDPARASDSFDGGVGQTLPGFRVVDAERGRRLTLEGRHRFSRYRLTFQLDDDQISARSEGAFPGVLGRMYRTAVIGTGAHQLITKRMLRRASAI